MIASTAQDFLDDVVQKKRDLVLPVELSVIVDGKTESLKLLHVCRLLPGKRVVCQGLWKNRQVAVKLFVQDEGADRHCQREINAAKQLFRAGIPAPELLATCHTSGIFFRGLIYSWVTDADDIASLWLKADRHNREILLRKVFDTLRKMHAAGILQKDIHLGNFLLQQNQLIVLDLGTISQPHGQQHLPRVETINNLASLVAQLPITQREDAIEILVEYAKQSAWPCTDIARKIRRPLIKAWRYRLQDYLDKSLRDCRLTCYVKKFSQVIAYRRDSWNVDLQVLLDNPDSALIKAEVLKSGNTATVGRIRFGEQALIIKRYNIKSIWHALSRMLRPTRAEVSWRNAHILELAGIQAARPVALIEDRLGIFRGKAFFISTALQGDDLLSIGQQRQLTTKEMDSLIALLESMKVGKISHGDFKASNLLVHDEAVQLIDLDAIKWHSSKKVFERAFIRDLYRLQRNWTDDEPISLQIKNLVKSQIEKLYSH
jgi:tRNA A-37 threonylcarbamoyl transferase component Bud32